MGYMADPSIARSTRTYILATLLAMLAATALIAMFFVIFCPARVNFVVTHASRSHNSQDKDITLHISISANTSGQRHTKVKFESIFVDLFNSSDRPQGSERQRINAYVDHGQMPDGFYLKYPGNVTINVTAARPSTFLDFAPDELIDGATGSGGLTVTVMAQVHFKIGVVRTRLYGIKVYCDHVIFPDEGSTTQVPPHNPDEDSTTQVPPHKFFPVTCQS